MAQSPNSSVSVSRRSSKHDLFCKHIPTLEDQLWPDLTAFTKLQDLCARQGILPKPSGAVLSVKDDESVSIGLSVREFLDVVAEKIYHEEAVYDKFVDIWKIALGQDSMPIVSRVPETTTTHPVLTIGESSSSSSSAVSVDNLSESAVPDPSPSDQESENGDGVANVELVSAPEVSISAVSHPNGVMAVGGNDVRRRQFASQPDYRTASAHPNSTNGAQPNLPARSLFEPNEPPENEAFKNTIDRLEYEKKCAFEELLQVKDQIVVKREKHLSHVTKLQNTIAEKEMEMNDLRHRCEKCEKLVQRQSAKIAFLKVELTRTKSYEEKIGKQERHGADLKKSKKEADRALRVMQVEVNRLTEEVDQSNQSYRECDEAANKKIAEYEKKIEVLINQYYKKKHEVKRLKLIQQRLGLIYDMDYRRMKLSILILGIVSCFIFFIFSVYVSLS